MDVGTVQSPAANIAMPGQKAGTPTPAAEIKTPAPMQVIQAQAVEAKQKIVDSSVQEKDGKEKEVVENTVESLNKFMDLMTADIRFSMHQKSNRLMVQLVSAKDQTVLREYPSNEFLDMIANIRDFVGILTDKKA
jgi:flagellar protein FlaG